MFRIVFLLYYWIPYTCDFVPDVPAKNAKTFSKRVPGVPAMFRIVFLLCCLFCCTCDFVPVFRQKNVKTFVLSLAAPPPHTPLYI